MQQPLVSSRRRQRLREKHAQGSPLCDSGYLKSRTAIARFARFFHGWAVLCMVSSNVNVLGGILFGLMLLKAGRGVLTNARFA